MQYVCPRTHFDVVLEARPNFSREAFAHFAKLQESNFAYSQSEIDASAFEVLAMSEMAKVARSITQYLPGYHADMSDAQLMSRIDPEMWETMMGALYMEYLCIGNFNEHGRHTYYVGRELTTNLCKMIPDVSVSNIVLPHPCIQLVYDSQIMRDAVCSVGQNPTCHDGTVSTYVMAHNVDEERFLALFSFITNKHGIEQQAQRIISLGRNNQSSASEVIANALEGDPIYPCRGDQSSRKGSLLRATINTLIYLGSRDADATPGLKPSFETASPKERRLLEETMTTLDYTMVGGWFTGNTQIRGRWDTSPETGVTLSSSKSTRQ